MKGRERSVTGLDTSTEEGLRELRTRIQAAIYAEHGHRRRAAARLGMSHGGFHHWMRALGMTSELTKNCRVKRDARYRLPPTRDLPAVISRVARERGIR